jgi:hypothetical protein
MYLIVEKPTVFMSLVFFYGLLIPKNKKKETIFPFFILIFGQIGLNEFD